MKSIVVAILLGLSASFSARAEILYFQIVAFGSNGISTSDQGDSEYSSWRGDMFYYNGHQITGVNIKRSDGTQLTPDAGDTPFDFMSASDYAESGELGWATYVDIGDVAEAGAYSYYIELVGYDEAAFGSGEKGVIGVSDTFSYAQLGGHIGTATGMNLTPWTGGTYNVPEPSGALLLLVGAALMGLKRRKV